MTKRVPVSEVFWEGARRNTAMSIVAIFTMVKAQRSRVTYIVKGLICIIGGLR